ncbi:MAG: class I SAM-dependent methyltransferase [Ferruginibacter sp.]
MDSSVVSYPVNAHAQTHQLEQQSFWYRHRNALIVKALKMYCTPGAEVYDLGGGNGIVSLAIQQHGYIPHLVEAMPQAVERAKAAGVAHVMESTLQTFQQRNLPNILLLDVAEHIEADAALFKQLYEQAAPNAKIIITVPAFQHLYTGIDQQIGHFRRYRRSALNKKLAAAGFKIVYSSYYFSLLYFPTLLFRVMPHLLGINISNNPQRRSREHLNHFPILNRLLLLIASIEIGFLKHKIGIPIGTSCFVVAEKKN